MRSSITPDELIHEAFMHESPAQNDNNISKPDIDIEARIAELENELKKQKAAAEKGAKLMQIIWGNYFHSDSLH